MEDKIREERLDKYFSYTREALEAASQSISEDRQEKAEEFLDMARRYTKDAEHFREEDDLVTSFAALNYAHGWLDAGARIGLFDVSDDRLFTVN